MAALVSSRCHSAIRACYERLLAAGKAKQVVRTGCMRKLLTIGNAIIKSDTSWQNPAAAAV